MEAREVEMQERQPDGRFRGASSPIEVTERVTRAQWVKAEDRLLRKRGWEFKEIANHISLVGRGEETAYTTLPSDIIFPVGYSISTVACWKACHPNRESRRRSPSSSERMMEALRLEQMFARLQPKINQGDCRAVNVALKIMK